jgi:hypothetical protein
MEFLMQALWELRQHLTAVSDMYQLDQWPVHPGYDNLIKGIAEVSGVDSETFWIWFENHCESLEQLRSYFIAG